MGGTCGDLLTALIDPKDAVLDNTKVILPADRQRFKKPHTFNSDREKTQYLKNISKQYNSIPSHNIEFHLKKKHQFVGITVEKFNTALWAAKRFKNMHQIHVWKEMQQACGGSTTKEYAQMIMSYSYMILQNTQKTVSLESILEGYAIEELKPFVPDIAGEEFYHTWLKAQNYEFS